MNLKLSNSVVISLGTNLGNKLYNLEQAIFLLSNHFLIEKQSKIYQSEPWGFKSTNDFLNMGLQLKSDLPPLEMLSLLKNIEFSMGRKPKHKKEFTDRVIDIDILLFNDLLFSSKTLVIPHPRILERKFVILLLKDIFGNNPVPVFSKTADSILLETSDLSKVEIYKNTL